MYSKKIVEYSAIVIYDPGEGQKWRLVACQFCSFSGHILVRKIKYLSCVWPNSTVYILECQVAFVSHKVRWIKKYNKIFFSISVQRCQWTFFLHMPHAWRIWSFEKSWNFFFQQPSMRRFKQEEKLLKIHAMIEDSEIEWNEKNILSSPAYKKHEKKIPHEWNYFTFEHIVWWWCGFLFRQKIYGMLISKRWRGKPRAKRTRRRNENATEKHKWRNFIWTGFGVTRLVRQYYLSASIDSSTAHGKLKMFTNLKHKKVVHSLSDISTKMLRLGRYDKWFEILLFTYLLCAVS